MQTEAPPPGSRTVAVLGATGNVGRQICKAFSRADYDILGVARNYAPHISDYKFVSMDVAEVDVAELTKLLDSQRVEVVVNATGGWVLAEDEMIRAHVHLVERLLTATAAMSRLPRIIHLGSIHEFGSVPFGTLIDENLPPNPTTAYGRTKLAGSAAVLAATKAGTATGVVIRPVNVCGPHTTEASFLGAVVAKLREAGPERGIELIIADSMRDYIDVRDVADAVVRAAEAPVVGRAINVGRGEAVNVRDLVSMLVAVAGFPPETIIERDGKVETRGGGWTRADIRLAGRLLGWAPRIGLRESIEAMWETRRRTA